MRRFILLLLVATLALSLVGLGCSKSGGEKEIDKVGFFYIGPIGDGGWSFSHNEGRLFLEKETGIATTYRENVPESPAAEKAMEDMISDGCNVIVGTSFGFMDYMENVSKRHKDVIFMHCSGFKTGENLGAFFGRIYQARYLSGIVAGLKTKADKIGYVAAYEIPEVIRGINAFTLGVRSVNPDAIVKVKWTHTWYDPVKEKDAAKALLDEGVDVIAQHQDTAGPQQAAEERGVWSVGYHTDMTSKAPKAHMTSAIWNFGPYYVKLLKSIQDGSWTPGNYWGGMEDDIVTLSPLTENAPEGAQAAIDKARADILNGSQKIFQGPINDQAGELKVEEGVAMSDEALLSFDWFVEGVEGKIR